MEINHLQENDIPQLYEFYKLIHPDNTAEEIKAYVDHWLAKVPNAMEYVGIQKEGDEVVGQNFFTPMSYCYRGEKVDSFWGFDLYVKEQYRKENYGVYLLLYNKKKYKNDFATGSGPDAMALIGKLGGIQIGEIHKYVGAVNPLGLATSVFRGIVSPTRFPKEVKVEGHVFRRITENELPDIATPYNNGLLEINHDVDFLKWKFFHSYREYAFYLDSQTNNYIVLRTIIKKHVTMLMVADYRCDATTDSQIEMLYQVATKVARRIGVAFLFCGSSLVAVDKVFERHHCKAIGRHRPVITYVKECKSPEHKEEIEQRNFVLVTLSDSDGEPL